MFIFTCTLANAVRLPLYLFIAALFIATYTKAQTCSFSLFVKQLNINTPKADFLLPLPGGGTLLGGMSFGQISHVSVVKTSPDGDALMHKEIVFPFYSGITKASLTPDYKLMVAHGPALALLDTNGVFLKGANANLSFGRLDLIDMKLDPATGHPVVLYRDAWSTPYAYVLAKFTPDLSTIIWSQRFYKHSDFFRGILVDGDKVLVCGQYNLHAADEADGTLICFSNSTGAFVRQVTYTLDGYRTLFNTVHKIKNGYLLKSFHNHVGQSYSTSTHSILRVDTALQPVKAVRFTNILNIHGMWLSPDSTGGYYGLRGTAWGVLFYATSRDSVAWTRATLGSYGFGMEQLASSSSHLYAMEASCRTLYKTDGNGLVSGGCGYAEMPFSTIPVVPAVIAKTPMTIVAGGVTHSDTSFSLIDRPASTTRLCGRSSVCSSLQLIGPVAICTAGDPVLFRGRRNDDCQLPVQWEIKGPAGTQEQPNDSTLLVVFSQSGTYQVIAKLESSCGVASDTLTIQVSTTSVLPPDLGPDKELCPGNNIVLNARKGYLSYLWQDGSSDSTFTVSQPGLYHVTVTDACGDVFKDSITISQAAAIALNVGPDRMKCNNDTVHISAPSGFLNYVWSNNYNISAITAQHVIVNPLVDTAYYIKAEKSPGCFAYDTIRILVNHSPAINLGPDKSFCAGDSAVFDAGGGFQSYAWSNGGTLQQTIAKTVGNYHVTGIAAEGCKSYDTVKVVAVHPLPLVNLDKGNTICEGESKTLHAGNFPSYLWSTGERTQAIIVSAIGQYSVTVTDGNGCMGSDVTDITTIHSPSRNFLPSDTAICSYGELALKPSRLFNQYLWSNGAVTPFTTITQPGLYWLQATDGNGCKGYDSVLVNAKQCMNGFYSPSAFTPNNDRKNDDFKPLLFGNIKNYRLTVYNRWGQVVFETTDSQKGWTGKFAGLPQPTGAYVWICRYQFVGEGEKMEKGTITLIR